MPVESSARRAALPVLTNRTLGRATLARQWLLERTDAPLLDVLGRLVGLQAQTPHTAYVGLWTRVAGFRPEELSDLIERRSVVRMALMRSTIHMVTASDAWRSGRSSSPPSTGCRRDSSGDDSRASTGTSWSAAAAPS